MAAVSQSSMKPPSPASTPRSKSRQKPSSHEAVLRVRNPDPALTRQSTVLSADPPASQPSPSSTKLPSASNASLPPNDNVTHKPRAPGSTKEKRSNTKADSVAAVQRNIKASSGKQHISKSRPRLNPTELSAKASLLFSPILFPRADRAPPSPPRLRYSRLPPPCAEVDDMPRFRVRRFKLWDAQVPLLRVVVLDPKRRGHLTRYQPFVLPNAPMPSWPRGVIRRTYPRGPPITRYEDRLHLSTIRPYRLLPQPPPLTLFARFAESTATLSRTEPEQPITPFISSPSSPARAPSALPACSSSLTAPIRTVNGAQPAIAPPIPPSPTPTPTPIKHDKTGPQRRQERERLKQHAWILEVEHERRWRAAMREIMANVQMFQDHAMIDADKWLPGNPVWLPEFDPKAVTSLTDMFRQIRRDPDWIFSFAQSVQPVTGRKEADAAVMQNEKERRERRADRRRRKQQDTEVSSPAIDTPTATMDKAAVLPSQVSGGAAAEVEQPRAARHRSKKVASGTARPGNPDRQGITQPARPVDEAHCRSDLHVTPRDASRAPAQTFSKTARSGSFRAVKDVTSAREPRPSKTVTRPPSSRDTAFGSSTTPGPSSSLTNPVEPGARAQFAHLALRYKQPGGRSAGERAVSESGRFSSTNTNPSMVQDTPAHHPDAPRASQASSKQPVPRLQHVQPTPPHPSRGSTSTSATSSARALKPTSEKESGPTPRILRLEATKQADEQDMDRLIELLASFARKKAELDGLPPSTKRQDRRAHRQVGRDGQVERVTGDGAASQRTIALGTAAKAVSVREKHRARTGLREGINSGIVPAISDNVARRTELEAQYDDHDDAEDIDEPDPDRSPLLPEHDEGPTRAGSTDGSFDQKSGALSADDPPRRAEPETRRRPSALINLDHPRAAASAFFWPCIEARELPTSDSTGTYPAPFPASSDLNDPDEAATRTPEILTVTSTRTAATASSDSGLSTPPNESRRGVQGTYRLGSLFIDDNTLQPSSSLASPLIPGPITPLHRDAHRQTATHGIDEVSVYVSDGESLFDDADASALEGAMDRLKLLQLRQGDTDEDDSRGDDTAEISIST